MDRLRCASPFLLLVVAWLATGCGDAVEGGDDRRAAINAYLRGLADLPTAAERTIRGDAGPAVREGDYACVMRTIDQTRRYDQLVAYAANSDTLWPGALVRADSIYSGRLAQVVFDRAPMRFSISLANLDGRSSAEMIEPSLSAFRDALGAILDTEVDGATPANLYSEIEEVHSQEQLELALGAGAAWPGAVAEIATGFDWSDRQIRSRFVVRFTQTYYTADVDPGATPADWLAPSVGVDDVQGEFGEGNPAAYVSSVSYGRIIVFTFESQYAAAEMSAALRFVYSGGLDVSGDVSVTYRDVASRAKITAFVLGGSGSAAVQAIDDYAALRALITTGGDYSKDSPGAPIAYKLSYLRDHRPAGIALSSSYEVEECARVSQKVKVTLRSIGVESAGGDVGGDLELYGTIVARAIGTATLLATTTDTYVAIVEGETWPQAPQVIAEGVIEVAPRAGEAIDLAIELHDYDPSSPDDLIGSIRVAAPFESGWRRDLTVPLTGDAARVVVTIGLEPI